MIFVLVDNLIKIESIKYLFKSAGNLTYALYLLHIPVQLIILIFAHYLNFTDTIYTNYIFFIAFFAIMIILSTYSFKFFEKPFNQLIRKKFKKNKMSKVKKNFSFLQPIKVSKLKKIWKKSRRRLCC